MNRKITTYIVNLEKRQDRRIFIEEEFSSHLFFEVKILKAIEDKIPAIGLYQSLCKVVRLAKSLNLPFFLFCEDDHKFTKHFEFGRFINLIENINDREGDILLGGVSWFECSVHVFKGLHWVSDFTGTQFMVIYSRFYESILKTPFNSYDTIDRWISKLSNKIFISTPMISIQKDFGYSDVTQKNNEIGKVQQLFDNTINRFLALDKIYSHIKKSNVIQDLKNEDLSDMQISTYIINLKERTDRLTHILSEFHDRVEFDTEVIEGCKTKRGSDGLWKSIKKVVSLAKERNDEVILICEDDHVFCKNYDKRILFSALYQGAYLGADIILGGISNTRQIIPVNENLCWVDSFQCTQFTIVYSQFFDNILNEDFTEDAAADLKLSNMTVNKYVIHPFISRQQDFGYSDIPMPNLTTELYSELFDLCDKKISSIRNEFLIYNS